MPSYSYGDRIEYYYLESTFPGNEPQTAFDCAGNHLNAFILLTSGLGIWNLDRNEKMSIQLRSIDYKGGLLPNTNKIARTLTWNNQAEIVYTQPLADNTWSDSRRLALSTGSSYMTLKQTLQDLVNSNTYDNYQPVYLISNIVGATNFTFVDRSVTLDSYTFVFDLMQSLANSGVSFDSFADVYMSVFGYEVSSTYNPTNINNIITWTEESGPDQSVVDWYNSLDLCFAQLLVNECGTNTTTSNILTSFKSCFTGPYAYAYKSNYSVYEILLYNPSTTPQLLRGIVTLPQEGGHSGNSFTVADIIILTIMSLALLVAAINLIFHCSKPRKPSMPLPEDRFKEAGEALLETEGRSAEESDLYFLSRATDTPLHR